MDCLEARRTAATSSQAANHVATCKMCNAVLAHPELETTLRQAAAALAAPAHLPDPWPSLQGKLASEQGVRFWLRSLPRGWVATLGLMVGLVVIALIHLRARGPHWDLWPLWRQLAVLVGGGALLAGGLSLGLRSLFEPPHKAVLWATGIAAIGAGILLAWAPVLLGASADDGPFVLNAAFMRQAFACARFGFFCVLPLLLWLAISHRWQPARPARRFASAASAALLGMLALEVHCPAVGLMHRLVGHASLGLALAIVALLFGSLR